MNIGMKHIIEIVLIKGLSRILLNEIIDLNFNYLFVFIRIQHS